MTEPLEGTARHAADEARRARETLREAYGVLNDAVDQVRRTVVGSDNPLPAAAVERCLGALTLTHRLATLVDGLVVDSRRMVQPSILPDVVVPLHEALGRVHRCVASVRALRQDAERVEWRVRRGAGADARLAAVAVRWGVAARLLDGLVARLEVGARALDAYLDGVVVGTDHGAVRRIRVAGVLPAVSGAGDAARVVRLVALAEPGRARRRNGPDRGLWTRRSWR